MIWIPQELNSDLLSPNNDQLVSQVPHPVSNLSWSRLLQLLLRFRTGNIRSWTRLFQLLIWDFSSRSNMPTFLTNVAKHKIAGTEFWKIFIVNILRVYYSRRQLDFKNFQRINESVNLNVDPCIGNFLSFQCKIIHTEKFTQFRGYLAYGPRIPALKRQVMQLDTSWNNIVVLFLKTKIFRE